MTDTLPHDLAAERAVLGAIFLKPASAVDAAARVLNGEEFYSPRHGNIFEAALGLHAAGQAVDPVTVRDALDRRGHADETMLADLSSLIADAFGTNPTPHARIVADKHRLRSLLQLAAEIRSDVAELTDAGEVLERAEQAIYRLSDRHRSSNAAIHFGEALPAWVEGLGGRSSSSGIPTGWVDLDNLLTGLKPGQLVIVAARPGMGKSAVIGQLACHTAHASHPTLLVSAEMALEELQDRFISSAARIDLQAIRSGKLAERDWQRLSHAMSLFAEMPLYVQEAPGATVLAIKAEARRVASRARGLGLVVVDYLQLLKPVGKYNNRETEVASVARGLKEMALELRVPVVAAAQLNRSLENRSEKIPVLADLRESGELEQAADVVIFPYREDYYNKDSPKRGTCKMIVAKQRNGPTGDAELTWLGQYGRLENMAVR